MLNKVLLDKILSLELYDRNNFILDLASKKNSEIYEVILHLIDFYEMNGKPFGTLVYALRNYPPEPLFLRCINWLIYGNFEVAHEAFEIINSINKIKGEEVDYAYSLIINSIKCYIEDWRRELLSEVLDMFN